MRESVERASRILRVPEDDIWEIFLRISHNGYMDGKDLSRFTEIKIPMITMIGSRLKCTPNDVLRHAKNKVICYDLVEKCFLKFCELENKPPLGIMPREMHDESRLRDLQGAIKRAYDADYEIKVEWIEEYNDLIRRGVR